MPDSVTDDQIAGSSPAEVPDVAPADSSPATDSGATVADSPPAKGANELSPLDVVERALSTEESPSSEDGEAGTKDPAAQAEEDLPDDPTEDELKGAPPTTQRRVEQLLDQRRGLRDQVGDLEPKARQWDQIDAFRREQNLAPEHVANAIQIAALVENDTERAFDVIGKLYSALAQRVGAVLPDDLQDSVKKGEITRERAVELSRAKAKGQLLEQRTTADTERRQEADNASLLTQHTQTLAGASTAWDTAKSTSDPDWQLKRQEVANRVEMRLKAEGLPHTVQAMQEVLNAETQAVERLLGQFRPAGRAVRSAPNSASPREVAPRKPKDHYDVVELALGEGN